MPDRSQHESGFELPRRRFVRPVVGFGVLVVAALIAGTLERSERTRSSGQGETTTLAGGHSMAHASEPGSSPENGLAAAPKLQVVYDAEAREIVLEIGPLDMPANASHHDVLQPEAQIGTLPVAGWIHGFRVELVDAEGREVPRSVLHHVNVISPDERELFSQIMLRIAAAGQETGAVKLPRLLGYPVREGHRLLVTAMFHNPTPQAYRGVKLRVRMDFTPVGSWLRPIPVYPLYMDVMPPAGVHAYDLPPGRSEKSWEGSPAIPGRLLGVGGHLHKYGVALRLEDVTTGELLWEATPILDDAGEVVGMPIKRFFWTLGVPLYPDHVYRLTAVYDNPTGEMIPEGAMGTLGGAFIPARGAMWPAADPNHPEYQLDVQVTTSSESGHGGGHDHGSGGHGSGGHGGGDHGSAQHGSVDNGGTGHGAHGSGH